MKRSPIKSRSRPLSRSSGIAKKNAKRSAKNHERAYGEKAEYIRRRFCWRCGAWTGAHRRVVAAHVVTGGTSRKSDSAFLIPLCERLDRAGCHDEQHQKGWSAIGLADKDVRLAIAASYEADYQAYRASRRTTET